ncbi:hypothetical protein AMQ84_27135 [Paenibacillus riograndensis]|uniref:Uncharacterized protein n=1 Tax=Paenibacillus riograndensis TaxID=483937 RepID=A0A132TJT5_9BACL|nr:hypothetical protein [Paenibacillus riograndensis]KWX71599.1 hypothetical protein AMQ84_27135 [Paenibacillus riograndensis]
MANLQGMDKKFFIAKKADVDNLDESNRHLFRYILNEIFKRRQAAGKKENTYIMINTDEPYADEVIEILKRNGHWGERDAEPNY